MPELLTYESHELPSHLAWQVHCFIRIHWFDSFQFDPNATWPSGNFHQKHFVMGEGKALYSYTLVLQKDLEHEGETYTCYGLGAVMTYPAFRRRGYGAQVVGAATDYIREQPEADIAVLWTTADLERFYGQHGWEHTPDIRFLSGDRDDPQVFDQFTMMLFLSEQGQRARERFAHQPVYFGQYTW